MKLNYSITKTYLFSNKTLTLVAALGIVVGISVFIFLDSMLSGFDKKRNELIFKTIPHIRIYKENKISKPLNTSKDKIGIIINPTTPNSNNKIFNPNPIIDLVKKQTDVLEVTPKVNAAVTYKKGQTTSSGNVIGYIPFEANKVFNLKSIIIEGDYSDLEKTANGIIIGVGIAKKFNLKVGDNISVNSLNGMYKNLHIVAIHKTNNSIVDKTLSYVNISMARTIAELGPSYVSEICIKIKDLEEAEAMEEKLSKIVSYKVESWTKFNETFRSEGILRKLILRFVSSTVIIVAAFGIYNILNMTVSQKINDIAILKAIGFKSKDIIQIFVSQAMTVGFIGVIGGILLGLLMVKLLRGYYVSSDVGYFPIYYELFSFIKGIIVGFVVTFLAGYMPAKSASTIDPIKIFRK